MNGAARGLLCSLAMLLMLAWLAEGIPAQPSAGPRHIGVVAPNDSAQSESAQAFRDGLRDAGYADARNIVSTGGTATAATTTWTKRSRTSSSAKST